jgi:hypothetical protein
MGVEVEASVQRALSFLRRGRQMRQVTLGYAWCLVPRIRATKPLKSHLGVALRRLPITYPELTICASVLSRYHCVLASGRDMHADASQKHTLQRWHDITRDITTAEVQLCDYYTKLHVLRRDEFKKHTLFRERIIEKRSLKEGSQLGIGKAYSVIQTSWSHGSFKSSVVVAR